MQKLLLSHNSRWHNCIIKKKLFLSSGKRLQLTKGFCSPIPDPPSSAAALTDDLMTPFNLLYSLISFWRLLFCPLLGAFWTVLWKCLCCSLGQNLTDVRSDSRGMLGNAASLSFSRCTSCLQKVPCKKCKWASGCWLLPIQSLLCQCCAVFCLGLDIGIFRRKLFGSILLDRCCVFFFLRAKFWVIF